MCPQITNSGENVEKKDHLYTVSGNTNWCSHSEKQYGVPPHKNKTAIWSNNSTAGYVYQKNNENTNSKRYFHPSVHRSTIYSGQDLGASQVPIKRWMDKEESACIYNWILSASKRMKWCHFQQQDGTRGYCA